MPVALLVVAHPDDEAMFFVPVVRRLIETTDGKVEVKVLCLSCGDFEGAECGAIRSREMRASTTLLLHGTGAGGDPPAATTRKGTAGWNSRGKNGFIGENLEVVDDPGLRDGPGHAWDAATVADFVERACQRWGASMLLTFDDYGVSGHSNHQDVHHGCIRFFRGGLDYPSAANVRRMLCLRSTGRLRKFTGVLDLPLSLGLTSIRQARAEQEYFFFAGLAGLILSFRCMRAHASQLVWFRYLFVFFSRYAYMNTLYEVPRGSVNDAILDDDGNVSSVS